MIEIRRKPRDPEDGAQYVGLAIGVLGAIVLSGLLTPLRTTLSASDFALALVVPVLLAAVVGGRWAGALSAIVAGLCFDFFFTKPYLSLRIASRNDITSFIVLLIVALITAEVGIRARRGGAAARESRSELDRLYRIAEFSARGGDVDDVVSAVRAELIGLFDLVECVFEATTSGTQLPRLGSRGALEGADLVLYGRDFVIPAGGVELPVVGRGHQFGRLVLFAHEATEAPIEKRLVAVAIADELGLTFAAQPTDGAARS
jgi:Domain of unknown function (DUF4118)